MGRLASEVSVIDMGKPQPGQDKALSDTVWEHSGHKSKDIEKNLLDFFNDIFPHYAGSMITRMKFYFKNEAVSKGWT